MKRFLGVIAAAAVFYGCAQQHRAMGGRSFAFGNYESASQSYDQALSYNSSDPNALLMSGWSSFKQGDYAKSLNSFSKLQQADPDSRDALEGLGWTYFKTAKYDSAIAAFQSLREKDKDSASAVEGIGYSYFKLGKVAEAKEYLRLAILENPRNSDTHLIRGYAAMMESDYRTAIGSFKKARSLLLKSNADLETALGNAYLGNNDKRNAERCFNRALKKDPNHAGALAGKQKV